MKMDCSNHPNLTVVHIREARIDAAVAIDFKDRMWQLTQGGAPCVILDLAEVSFIDSSGLGAIVALRKALAPDRRLELMGLTSPVQRVFRLTRMDHIFTIHPEQAFGGDMSRNAG